MFRSIRNIPIFPRLVTVFTLATIIPGMVIFLLGNFYLDTLNTRGQAVQTSFEAQNIATQEQINLQRMNALLQARFAQIFANGNTAALHGDPSLKASGDLIEADIVTRTLEFSQVIVSYQNNYEIATSSNMNAVKSILQRDNPTTNNVIISNQQDALDKVANTEWKQYKTLQNKVLSDLNTNQSYQISYADLYSANLYFFDLQDSWQHVVDDATKMGTAVTQIGNSITQPVIMYTALALLFTLLFILMAGFIVNLTITRPLGQLAALTKLLGKGDSAARAPTNGRDEISTVAAAINSMLENIVRLVQEAQARHANLQAQVEKLVNEVSGVGEGDLSIQAEVTSDDLGVLADSFNYMVEELSNLVVHVKLLTQEVEYSTTSTFDHMAHLVKNADVQIAQIEGATTEVGSMADASRHVAERAQILYSIAFDARQTVQHGRNSLQQTVEGIGRVRDNVHETANHIQMLGERSREINGIIDVISTIAHLTNRLALDAAIQAAMAGENGKGFGAVASDIRRLAERAKEQATMITRIGRSVLEEIKAASISMQNTEQETSVGTQLAQEAGTALESLFAVVEHQATEIETINQMANQQMQSSSTVVQLMQAVTTTTHQSNISTREASQQIEKLARLAEQLRASVEAFKPREEPSYHPLTSNTKTTISSEPPKQFTLSGKVRTITSSAQFVPSYD
ncbi:MAG TPA: methyl-accepting chemotaxis protein, partial [Ktedonosporobacter sp.]|nr:methyl-accepting chemotaxis protein [Ktedonosporobacter sp.]